MAIKPTYKNFMDSIGGLKTAGQGTPVQKRTDYIARLADKLTPPEQRSSQPIPTPERAPATSTQGYKNVGAGGAVSPDVLEMQRLAGEQAQPQTPQGALGTSYDEDIANAQQNFLTPAVQAQIDAISKVYANQLQEAQRIGQGQVGQVQAMSARSGMTGSRSGLAQTQNQEDRNLNREKAIDSEKGAIIANILGEAEQRAITNAQDRRESVNEENEAVLQRMKESQESARADFKQISGLSDYYWDAVPNEEKQTWLDQTGYDPELAKLMFNQGKGEADGLQWETVWKGSTMIELGKDPKTGQTMERKTYDAEALGIPTDADPKFITNDLTGQTGWIDQNNMDSGINWLGKTQETEAEKRASEFGYDVALSELKDKGGDSAGSEYSQERTQRILDSILGMPDAEGNKTGGLMNDISWETVGWGVLAAGVPTSKARDFKAKLDTLHANISFNEITEMREASKTGGALGQVSERELALLQSSLGALDQGQSEEQFKKELTKVVDSLERWKQAKAQYGNTQPQVETQGQTSPEVQEMLNQGYSQEQINDLTNQ